MFIFLAAGKCVISAPSLKAILVYDDEVDQAKRPNELLRSRDWEILRKNIGRIPTKLLRIRAAFHRKL